MRNLSYDPTHRRSIRPCNGLVKLGHTERFHDLFLLLGEADRAPVILDLYSVSAVIYLLLCHFFSRTTAF